MEQVARAGVIIRMNVGKTRFAIDYLFEHICTNSGELFKELINIDNL